MLGLRKVFCRCALARVGVIFSPTGLFENPVGPLIAVLLARWRTSSSVPSQEWVAGVYRARCCAAQPTS